MSATWPTVPLAGTLIRARETIEVQPESHYSEITVKLWGRGVVQRRVVSGAEIGGGRRFVARAGQLILSRIDARNGAIGVVPTELDGSVVTNDFPLFDVSPDKLVPAFLGWLSRTEEFVELCRRASEGTTNRVRLQEERFLALEIPLPPLAEQRRIVGRIEQVSERVAEASALRKAVAAQIETLIAAGEQRVWSELSNTPHRPLSELTCFLARGRQSEQGESEQFLIKTQHVQLGRYIPTKLKLADHAAVRVAADALVQAGDILIACSAAGCLGRVARYEGTGTRVSTDTHVALARADSTKIDPDYLYVYLRSAPGQFQLRSRERGDWTREKVGFRLTELNVRDLRAVPVPVPDPATQRRIVDNVERLRTQVEALSTLQAATAAELDALLPSIHDKAFSGAL